MQISASLVHFCVPQEWKDSLMVPIRDLSVCDNWRSISLLDIGESCSPSKADSGM